MARLATLGFEWGQESGDMAFVSGIASKASVAAAARTGTYGCRMQSTDAGSAEFQVPTALVLARKYFFRGYFRKNQNPGSDMSIMATARSGANQVGLQLTTSGSIYLEAPVGQQWGPSAALSNDTWYRLEIAWVISSGSLDDFAEFYLDGTLVATQSGVTIDTIASDRIILLRPTASGNIWDWDDCAFNDDQGSFQNNYPGDGKVVLFTAEADSQVGSWRGGAGGTTDLFDAVNNIPPVGTATETDTTQIESADGSGDNATDEYRAGTALWNTKLADSDIIKVVQPIINHGEDVNTGSKTGSFGCFSNPAGSLDTGITFGENVGALGTFPTNWYARPCQTPVYNPTVTRTNGMILNLRKTDTSSRVVSVDAFGAYVDYVSAPPAGPPLRALRRRIDRFLTQR